MAIPFTASKHPRATGGRFQATGAAQAAAAGHPTGPWAAGPIRKVSGQHATRDERVAAMQRQLNALGVTDEHGRPLLVDGIPGNHTIAAVKKWQAAHGLPQSGVVDAKTMVAMLSDRPQPKKPSASARMRSGSSRRTTKPKPATKPKTSTKTPVYADRGRGFSRFGGTAST